MDRDMNRQFSDKEIKTINKHMKRCSKSHNWRNASQNNSEVPPHT